jgi:hypothetical protein
MPFLIVEYDFSPPVTNEDLGRMKAALTPCLEVRNIRKLRSIISEDGRRAFCEYEAVDAETLREAYRVAGIGFRTVWPAQLYDFNPPSQG